MSKTAKVTLHPDYKIGTADKRLYGAFLEPIYNFVYGGIWNPKHPTADDKGFRRDILQAMRDFDLPLLRFPGGNWVSGWDWKNSIGPVEQRKRQLDLAWFQIETNEVGHDEYIEWCMRAGAEPLYTINVCSEDLKSAFHLVEYTNHPGGTYWSDLRRKYGHPDPYNIKLWCLGNEPDGSWQIASWEKDPTGYGIRAHEISKIIKWIDCESKTVVAGSSSHHQDTYPEWNMKVLEQCYETVDYISLHHYHMALENDPAYLLNSTSSFEEYIKDCISVCDYMKSKKHSTKDIMISFDEFGCRFTPKGHFEYGRADRRDYLTKHEFRTDTNEFILNDPNKPRAGFRNNTSQMLGALSSASVFLSFLRYADRVKIACMTGGLHTAITSDGEHLWKTASYYPYYHLNKYGRGTSLLPVVNGPTYNTEQFAVNNGYQYPSYENVQCIDAASVLNEEKDELTVFLVNRDLENDIEVTLDLRGFEGYKLIEHSEMYTDDLNKANTHETPNAIVPQINKETKLEGGIITAAAKKLSWNVIRLTK